MQPYSEHILSNLKNSHPNLNEILEQIKLDSNSLKASVLSENVIDNILNRNNPAELLFTINELIENNNVEELFTQLSALDQNKRSAVMNKLQTMQREFNIQEKDLYSDAERTLAEKPLPAEKQTQFREITKLIQELEQQVQSFEQEQIKNYNLLKQQQAAEIRQSIWQILKKEGFIVHQNTNQEDLVQLGVRNISHVLEISVQKNLPLKTYNKPVKFDLNKLHDSDYNEIRITLKNQLDERHHIEAEVAAFYILRNIIIRWINGPELSKQAEKLLNQPDNLSVKHLSAMTKKLNISNFFNARFDTFEKILNTLQEAKDSILELKIQRNKLFEHE